MGSRFRTISEVIAQWAPALFDVCDRAHFDDDFPDLARIELVQWRPPFQADLVRPAMPTSDTIVAVGVNEDDAVVYLIDKGIDAAAKQVPPRAIVQVPQVQRIPDVRKLIEHLRHLLRIQPDIGLIDQHEAAMAAIINDRP